MKAMEYPTQSYKEELESLIVQCVLACIHELMNIGAVKSKKQWNGRSKKLRIDLIREQVLYILDLTSESDISDQKFHIGGVASDAFNRSVGVLVKNRNINNKELRKHYKGIGSKYYDIVTEIIEEYNHTWGISKQNISGKDAP